MSLLTIPKPYCSIQYNSVEGVPGMGQKCLIATARLFLFMRYIKVKQAQGLGSPLIEALREYRTRVKIAVKIYSSCIIRMLGNPNLQPISMKIKSFMRLRSMTPLQSKKIDGELSQNKKQQSRQKVDSRYVHPGPFDLHFHPKRSRLIVYLHHDIQYYIVSTEQ